jgi:putative membrane protein
MFRRVSLSLLACAGLLGTPACKSENAPPPEAPQTTAGAPEHQFTAGDTLGVLRAIHSGEIDHGMLAQKKASDPRVRDYAEKLVNDHKGRMQKDEQLSNAVGVAPRDSEISSQIKSSSDRETSNLQSMSGVDFDRTYLDGQISYFRMVLDTLDRDLLPNARDPQLRASLQNSREQANDHLREAQELRNAISMPGPTP